MSKHEIFICFSSKDEATARKVLQFLEARGLKCWISLRDVPTGQNYQESIVQALENARGIVFLYSEFSSESGEIKKELSLGGRFKVPVFPLRLVPITPTGALSYELATRQWIDIFPNPVQALGKLAATIEEALKPAMADGARLEPSRTIGGSPATTVRTQAIKPPAKKRVKKTHEPAIAANGAELEEVRVLLARYIGPIAKIFVQKAAADARSLDDLCERLSIHVPVPADRASFLQVARARLLSVKS
jgi:hypothetical protein